MNPILNKKLSPYYNPQTCIVEWLDADSFICPKRLDIFVKYLYAKSIISGKDTEYYQKLYLAHIDAFGHFVEKDKIDKVGKTVFLERMDSMVKSIQKDGYNIESVIPYDIFGIAMDGAHRIAVSAALGIKVPAMQLHGVTNPSYDGQFFRDRLINLKCLDRITCEYAKWKDTCRLVYGTSHDESVVKTYGDIVNWKSIKRNGRIQKVFLVEPFDTKTFIELKNYPATSQCVSGVFNGDSDVYGFVEWLDIILSPVTYINYSRRIIILIQFLLFKVRCMIHNKRA